MTNDGVNHSRRRFLLGATSVVGGAGVVGAAVPFVSSWQPSAKAKAAGAPVKVNISKLEVGGRLVVEWRGKPAAIRCDNGPEYISGAIQNWAAEWGIRLEHIQPGNPQQNAYVERFNRTVRYEWLSQYYWRDLAQVQDFATKWMWAYNHDRPNMALGGSKPKQRLAMTAQRFYF